MVRNYFFLALFLFFSANSLVGAVSNTIYRVNFDESIEEESLRHAVLPDAFIDSISLTANSLMPQDEFLHVIGLQQSSQWNQQEFLAGIQRLKRTGKISSAQFSFDQKENGHLAITCQVDGGWRFKNITFRGMLQGKDLYRHLYDIEPGEQFAIDKHRASLEKIRSNLHEQGYLNARLYDYFSYDSKKKMVTVFVTIDFGQLFFINSCRLQTESSEYRAALSKILRSNCLYRMYSKQRLVDCCKKLNQYLAQQGVYASSIFLKETVQSDAARIEIECTVKSPEYKKILFVGNHFFSHAELNDIVFAFGKSGGVLPVALIKQELIDAYKAEGFWRAFLTIEEHDDSVVIKITEGDRVKLAAVSFCNNHGIPSDTLKSFFTTLCGQYYKEELLADAEKKIHAFYRSQGFLSSSIAHREFLNRKSGSCNVCYSLHEGPQYRIKEVVVSPYSKAYDKELFTTCRGKPFDPSLISAQQQWLQIHFQGQGFLYATATPQVVMKNNEVTIRWAVEGVDEPVRFGKPLIAGSSQLPLPFIMRELAFKEGDVWCKDTLEESMQRLRKLGIFETIHVYPDAITKKELFKPIVIKLKDDDPFEVRTRIGFQQVSRTFGAFHQGTTYKFGGSFLYKNPFNQADILRTDFDITRFYRNFSCQYQRPWIFNLPIAFQAKGYSNKYIQPVFVGSDKPLYRATQQGGLIALSKTGIHYDVGINSGIETMETDDLSMMLAREINFEPILIDQKIPYFFIEPTAVLNYLDNPLNPHSGSLTIFSCKGMIPWKSSTVAFLKVLFEHSFFIPIKSTVVAFRMRAGHIFNKDFDTIMPPERFYLGGPNSLRSYQPNLAPPLGSFVDKKGKRQLVPQGGKSMANLNFEYRFPLLWQVGMVLFQDLGVLAQRSITEVVHGNRLLAGTGFGLRYHTPVGPLRFDIGFRWKRFDPDEDGYAWYLTLGQAF